MTDSGSSSTNGAEDIRGVTDNTAGTNLTMQLELTDEVKKQEIVTSYVFEPKTDSLCVELNHKYSKKKIISPIESTWPKTMDTLTKELQRRGINPEHITMLCDVADNAADRILRCRLNKLAESELEQNRNAEEQCQELFVNQYVEPYAAVKIKEHIETLNLNHTRFKNWISKAYYEQERTVPSSDSITNVLNILKAKAEFDGNSKELHLRVACDTKEDETGTTRTIRTTISYDLTNKDWEAIKITSEGWTIEKAPIIFRRHNAKPQVYPYIPIKPSKQSGTLANLDNNTRDESKRPEQLFICRYCRKYNTTLESEYRRHIVLKHPGKSGYPNMTAEDCN